MELNSDRPVESFPHLTNSRGKCCRKQTVERLVLGLHVFHAIVTIVTLALVIHLYIRDDSKGGEVDDMICINNDFSNGSVFQLWSLMSESGDQYVSLTNRSVPGNSGNALVLDAAGTTEGENLPFIRITFIADGPSANEWYFLQFQRDNSLYRMSADADNVTAKPEGSSNPSRDSQLWCPVRSQTPNRPYYLIRSKQLRANTKLYLTSNGKGDLKLKPSNTNSNPQFGQSYHIDAGMLFRSVEPTT